MIELLASPIDRRFAETVRSAERNLLLCSPYVGQSACKSVLDLSKGRMLSVEILTNLSVDNLLSNATDAAAIFGVASRLRGTTVRFVPGLHAKVYVADEKVAIITSANMTEGGLSRNLEYGVLVRTPELVRQVRRDMVDYGALGTVVSREELAAMAQTADRLRTVRRKAESTARKSLLREFRSLYEEAVNDSMRLRAAGRTMHAIFADAILFFLSKQPMTTQELHEAIQALHPDFCDDRLDRVIDGKHFGKKWKHAVRTAQAHLKRSGLIALGGRLWHRA